MSFQKEPFCLAFKKITNFKSKCLWFEDVKQEV
jgi:hypothetical protein